MRLAIVATHPIQYYSPWFRYLASLPGLEVQVLYLWDFGVKETRDAGFGQTLKWDVPLLDGYSHEFVPNHAKRPGTSYFRGFAVPELPARLRAFNPDAVFLMAYNYAALWKLILTWPQSGPPLLFRGDSHRILAESGMKAALKRGIISSLFRRFAAVLCVGEANREYFLHHGVAPERIFRAPHTVDNARFLAAATEAGEQARAWRRELGIPEHHAVVLFVGKLQEKKRPQDLLEAFRRAQLPDATLLFVGAGDLGARVKADAEGVPNVLFAPFQNQSQIPRTLAAGDVVVLPSKGSGETWGLIVNEAFLLQRSVIVSTHVGCARDLVTPGETGLVFPAGDVDALAAALKEALSDRERLRAWGRNGRERIVAGYSYQAAAEGLLEALRFATGKPIPTANAERQPA